MDAYKNTAFKTGNKKFICMLYISLAFLLFVWGFTLLCYPETAAEGVSSGIKLCLETVIPSLFPFMLFSSVLSDSGLLMKLAKFSSGFSRMAFALPGVAVPIMLLSAVGGYPVGAFLIRKAVLNGGLSASQGRRMLLFCVNPGPAFAVSAIGGMLIGSKAAGVVIYASTVVSSLLIGILTRFIARDKAVTEAESNICSVTTDTYSVISEAVNSGTRSIFNICVWIVIFSSLNALADILPFNQSFLIFFKSFSEVTNGVIVALENYPLPLISGVVAFAGICVHLQILPCLTALKLKYKFFLISRIIAAAASTAISYVLYEFYPISRDTVSVGSKPVSAAVESSLPVCVCLLFMCGLFIIGDNYILSKKREIHTDN